MPNLVLGIIDKYKFSDISTFLLSLKRVHTNEHVCLFAGPKLSAFTIWKVKKLGFEVIRYKPEFPFIPAPHESNFKQLPTPIHIYNFRHYLYYDYLLKHGDKFENVLITDVKDVYFQRNPFDFDIEEKIYVAVENIHIRIEGCKYTSRWIRQGYGEKMWETMKNEEVICAGTTLAPTKLMKRYLQRLIEEFPAVENVFKCADQAMHNVLIHQNEIQPIHKCYNFKGPILTVGTEPRYVLNSQRNLVDESGNIIPIIHQYDRHKELLDQFRMAEGRFTSAKSLWHGVRTFLTKS